jgi:hypothetical protein
MAGIDRFAIMVADQQVIWCPPDDGCGTETTGHTFDRAKRNVSASRQKTNNDNSQIRNRTILEPIPLIKYLIVFLKLVSHGVSVRVKQGQSDAIAPEDTWR